MVLPALSWLPPPLQAARLALLGKRGAPTCVPPPSTLVPPRRLGSLGASVLSSRGEGGSGCLRTCFAAGGEAGDCGSGRAGRGAPEGGESGRRRLGSANDNQIGRSAEASLAAFLQLGWGSEWAPRLLGEARGGGREEGTGGGDDARPELPAFKAGQTDGQAASRSGAETQLPPRARLLCPGWWGNSPDPLEEGKEGGREGARRESELPLSPHRPPPPARCSTFAWDGISGSGPTACWKEGPARGRLVKATRVHTSGLLLAWDVAPLRKESEGDWLLQLPPSHPRRRASKALRLVVRYFEAEVAAATSTCTGVTGQFGRLTTKVSPLSSERSRASFPLLAEEGPEL